MAIATFIFWLGTKHYVRVPPSRETKSAGFFKVFFAAVSGQRAPGQKFWDAARGRFSEKEIDAAKSVLPILGVFSLIPIFFSLFDQTNSTWVLQGEKMVPTKFLGLDIGAEQMQSMNPLIVMILVPLFTLGIYPYIGRLASPLRRMTYGMFLAAASYLVVAALQKQIEAGAQLSILWQTLPYFILTAAEVLVSTTGLEFAFREAAPEMKSIVMSFWLLMIALGDLFVAVLTKLLAGGGDHAASVSTGRFMQYAGMTFVVAILFSIIATFYKYRDASAAQGK
jgi:POT family proton-dependent oligopeptide transporter